MIRWDINYLSWFHDVPVSIKIISLNVFKIFSLSLLNNIFSSQHTQSYSFMYLLVNKNTRSDLWVNMEQYVSIIDRTPKWNNNRFNISLMLYCPSRDSAHLETNNDYLTDLRVAKTSHTLGVTFRLSYYQKWVSLRPFHTRGRQTTVLTHMDSVR